ncbi:MAG: 2OG-Fe(II) oxygenase [Gammaproteobacteria bacterium]|nr:2OG-Fe(II) oxygenase [Gammaproteobacteria bacterium]
MKPSFSVPLVDISAYVAGGTSDARRVVATQLEQACRTLGFIQIRGHGIADATIDALASAMDAFFAQPPEWKQSYRMPPEINRGYTPPLSESLALTLGLDSAASLKDYFEAFNIGVPADAHPGLNLPRDIYSSNPWPACCADFDGQGFRSAVEAYFSEAGRVARTLCRIFADALGVDPELFASVTEHSADVLRMINYALAAGSVAGDVDPLGMGAHTDYGIVTVLWADRVPGLQVLGPGGLWQDVQPAEGALLVNLGDLTARWTNDQWLSTLHRVKPPVVDGVIQRRRSAAYFHDGNIDAVISTIPTCVGRDGRQYPPISIGEHLSVKLASSRAGKPNTTKGPEAERARIAKG